MSVRDGELIAQRFDASRRTLTGESWRATAAPLQGSRLGVTASTNGTVGLWTGPPGLPELIWFDRTGKELERIPDARDFAGPELSPDRRFVAVRRTLEGNADVWVYDLERGGWTRITRESTSEAHPVWSPESRRVAFFSSQQDGYHLLIRPMSTMGTIEPVVTLKDVFALNAWSPDGEFLVYSGAESTLWAVPVNGDRQPKRLVERSYNARNAQFSPDGKWIAYQSEETGRSEIWAQPFPGPGERVQVTTTGGAQVRWSRTGRELFYIGFDDYLMAVPIRAWADGHPPVPDRPVQLFKTRIYGGAIHTGASRQQYVVSADGQRFLVSTISGEVRESPISLITNWRPNR